MPIIKIRQSEQKDHEPVTLETGSEQKFTSSSSDKKITETRTNYEDPTAEE